MDKLKKYLIPLKPFWRWSLLFLSIMFILFIFSFPGKLFTDPTSTVVFDSNGQLLGARIADDEQWRFPASDSIPQKFATCIITFEDRYFYKHPGVNPYSLLRALGQNLTAGKIVSGGSTITMQLIRLSRKNKQRTILEKLIEIWLALRLECSYSKSEILLLHASHAPFGGNVVGLDAAAWRYFNRDAKNLSWAESAALAVLPNAPALIHPGRNRDALLEKRNLLLDKLLRHHHIDSLTWELSKKEPLPEKPVPLPHLAQHLVTRLDQKNHGNIAYTHLNSNLQSRCNEIINQHVHLLKGNGINNAALMIIENRSGNVLAYVGNSTLEASQDHGQHVDVIMRPRSSGSTLKPLLYAAMLDAGELLPTSLVADIPTTISNYSPKNFNVSYDGAVPASEALIRSLNVPAVRLLGEFGQERFYNILKNCGISTLDYGAAHYGLSLILGGSEVNLWDLCKVYGSLANSLNYYEPGGNGTKKSTIQNPKILSNTTIESSNFDIPFTSGAIFTTFEAMKEVRRPEAEMGWKSFLSSYPIAWKTGTSFGFRDAWSVGVTPDYTVGVWVGNADGEGRPGLTGIKTAAPIMFAVFDLLPAGEWFEPPWEEMVKIPVCAKSGMRPGKYCLQRDTVLVPESCLKAGSCKYHRLLHLDKNRKYRVHASCYPQEKIVTTPWFILPPAMAWFYRSKNPFYKDPPNWKAGCNPATETPMQLIWPDKPAKIYIPIEMDGQLGKVVFEAAHSSPGTTILWYVDEEFVGETRQQHKQALQPQKGFHKLVLVDSEGNILEVPFEIVSEKEVKKTG